MLALFCMHIFFLVTGNVTLLWLKYRDNIFPNAGPLLRLFNIFSAFLAFSEQILLFYFELWCIQWIIHLQMNAFNPTVDTLLAFKVPFSNDCSIIHFPQLLHALFAPIINHPCICKVLIYEIKVQYWKKITGRPEQFIFFKQNSFDNVGSFLFILLYYYSMSHCIIS